MSDAPIWLVSGVPGAGKTSVAIALCRRYPKAIHLPVDDLREMVCSGRATPLHWNDETSLQFTLARRGAARMAVDYAEAGFAAIIDDVARETDLGQYTPQIADRKLRKVLLLPKLETVLERNRRRSNKAFDTALLEPVTVRLYPTLAEGCQPADGWIVIDSTTLTADATVDAILKAAHEKRQSM